MNTNLYLTLKNIDRNIFFYNRPFYGHIQINK